ncbi:helix-turn-helix domain-containing protein [Marinococcus halotolerans]|uniref:helix-turn-helix domain-containing protein n=1 Tax=Marinococcus halotolerans TaxID=301092 RepID=UPI0003B43546|nr:RodZ domain-containing protein [Marinococcus halotolerans]
MAELGPYLRGERERQGASLELMQQRTKIQRRYLQAIESGDYGALPGAFYARAFIRSYAEALGLNAEDVFRQYGHELPAPRQQPAEMPSRASRKQTRSRSQQKRPQQKQKKTSFLPFIIALIFFLIIGAGIWLLFQNVNSDTQTQQQNDEGTGVQFESGSLEEEEGETAEESAENSQENNGGSGGEENEGAAEEEPADADVQLEETSSDGDNASYDVIGAEAFELTMSFSGNSYVDITDADGEMLDMFASQSDGDELEETYEAEEITVNVGNTNNMELTVNGREFSYPTDGTHQIITFTAVPEE